MMLAPTPRSPLNASSDAKLPYPVVRHPRFVSTRYFVPWYRRWLVHVHRRFRFDVLHCHSVHPTGYLAAVCREQLKVPVVITSHGGDVEADNPRLRKPGVLQRHVEALASADALIAISRFTSDGYLRLYPQAKNIIEIPNGVDLAPLSLAADRPAELDPAIQAGKYLLFLGRLDARKGVDLLLDALARLPARGGVEMVIAGIGREMDELQAKAAALAITDRIRFVGRAAGAVKTWLLQNCIATVMPSRWWEAFPLVVLESYAAGRPVIGTRIPGLGDLVQHERTGWLVPPDDVAALAEAMTDAFAHSEFAQQLGRNALQHAQGFAWPNVARRHLELFDALLSRRSIAAA
jgi:glycosyltransferase involved in cell wall biosynthesis